MNNNAIIDRRLLKFFVIAPEYVRSQNPIAQKSISLLELQIMAMGFGSLTHSGALTKKFGSLRSIFALLFAF